MARKTISKGITVGSDRVVPGRFNVLNDSASPKMVIEMYFIFFRFFEKVLELFECRRGDPYMTANRNFVCFSYS